MLESLVLFAPLVLIADITSRDNAMAELGTQIFFWARLVYAIVYIVGVPWVRTAVWGVSVIGLVLIFLGVPPVMGTIKISLFVLVAPTSSMLLVKATSCPSGEMA